MSREGKLAKNTLILAIGTFFPKLAIFIALPILTTYLSNEEYGIYELFFSMVTLILPAATLQIQSAAFRFLIEVQDQEEEKTRIITNICLFVIATALAVLLLVFFLLQNLDPAIRLAVCFYYFVDILVNVARQIVRGLSRNKDYAVSAIISGAGQIAFMCLLVMGLKKGLFGGLLALGCGDLISTIYLVIRGGIFKYIRPTKFDKKRLKEMLGYSWPMVPNSLSQWVIHASDRAIITFFMGPVANGIYSAAYKIPSIISLAQTTFNLAWQENATIASKDSDVQAYYSSMFKSLLNIVGGIMAVLIGMTPILFSIFIRGDYSEAYNQIPILHMGMFCLCMSTFWGGIFVALKKTKAVGITTVTAAAISVALNLLLINVIGLYASSIASCIAYSVMCLLRAFSIQKFIKISYDFKHILLVVGVLILQCVICFMQNLPLNILNLAVGIAFGYWLNRGLVKVILAKVKSILRSGK